MLFRYKNAILLSLLVVVILPYFIICFYALPFADDFCYAWTASEKVSLLQKFLRQYLHWNGRYTFDLLVNIQNPLLSGLLAYQMSAFILLASTAIVFFLFVKIFIRDFFTALFAALSVLLFYCCYQPDLTQGIYWFIGAYTYHLGNLFFLLHLVFLWRGVSNEGAARQLHYVAAAILLVLSIGCNEVGAALIPAYYLLAAIISYRLKENRKLMTCFFGIAFAAAAFVFFAPGNTTRMEQFPTGFRFIHSLIYSVLQTVRFTATWSLSLPFLGFSILILASAGKIKGFILRQVDYRIVLALLIYTVFMGSFMPYMGTGILGQHRTMNYVFFYFIFLWIWFLLALSEQFSLGQRIMLWLINKRALALTLICILIMGITGNSEKILSDFIAGRFITYKSEFLLRQQHIISNPGKPISPLKNIPQVFVITDTKADTSWFADKCMNKFYTETGVVLR
jgi:hypothetical protein